MHVFLESLLLTSPLGLTLTLNGIFPVDLYCNKDEKWLPNQGRIYLEEKIKEVALKLGVTKKIEILDMLYAAVPEQGHGSSLLPGRAGIIVNSACYYDRPLAVKRGFKIAREIAHIKNNDTLSIGVVVVAAGVISSMALAVLFPFLAVKNSTLNNNTPATTIGIFVATPIALVLFSRWREACADKTALSICSQEEKQAALDGVGEDNGNIFYPSHQARRDYILASLKQD